jgi:hypothetical protein
MSRALKGLKKNFFRNLTEENGDFTKWIRSLFNLKQTFESLQG